MNWRRGLFRLWIVGSVLFVIAVAVISYGDIKEQFDAARLEAIRSQLDTSRPLPQWTDDELRAYIAMPKQITPTATSSIFSFVGRPCIMLERAIPTLARAALRAPPLDKFRTAAR